jgi:hypothetical protein
MLTRIASFSLTLLFLCAPGSLAQQYKPVNLFIYNMTNSAIDIGVTDPSKGSLLQQNLPAQSVINVGQANLNPSSSGTQYQIEICSAGSACAGLGNLQANFTLAMSGCQVDPWLAALTSVAAENNFRASWAVSWGYYLPELENPAAGVPQVNAPLVCLGAPDSIGNPGGLSSTVGVPWAYGTGDPSIYYTWSWNVPLGYGANLALGTYTPTTSTPPSNVAVPGLSPSSLRTCIGAACFIAPGLSNWPLTIFWFGPSTTIPASQPPAAFYNGAVGTGLTGTLTVAPGACNGASCGTGINVPSYLSGAGIGEGTEEVYVPAPGNPGSCKTYAPCWPEYDFAGNFVNCTGYPQYLAANTPIPSPPQTQFQSKPNASAVLGDIASVITIFGIL